ncbi:MAG: HYR domain-containing protein [Saprospiraceae bacterium]|nr:HYR domain-containing protein [Saprospiraceae bacterium]
MLALTKCFAKTILPHSQLQEREAGRGAQAPSAMQTAQLPYAVTNGVSGCGNLVITGVIDGPLTGGIPKAVEFYALTDIPDLSAYGFGSANNGGGSDGQEFTFPAVAVTAGTHIWVATEAVAFQAFFGFAPTYVNANAPSINGDDAIELFCNGMVIDVFGDINLSGTGQPWEYMDGWAYRVNNTGPDASFFQLGNWTFSGINALDNQTTNATSPIPFPVNTYTGSQGGVCPNDFHTVNITINDLLPPVLVCPPNITVTLQAGLCETSVQLSGVSATDNCDLSVVITQVGGIPFGDYFPIGIHPVVMRATDDLGNFSTCTFDVIVLEYPFPSQSLVCNTLVQATIGQNGMSVINADMILEGGPYGCYDDYIVTITDDTGLELGNVLTCNQVGDFLIAKVMDPDNGNSCWGQIVLEDKTPPVITCQDWTIPCTKAVNSVSEPTVVDNCDAHPVLELGGITPIELDACDDNAVRFLRTWYAIDIYGNTSMPCLEIITVERPMEVDFPTDIVWQCYQYATRNQIVNATKLKSSIVDTDLSTDIINVSTSLITVAQLSGTGSGVPENIIGEYCKYNYSFSDEIIFPCGDNITGVFEIIRTWTVIDWCTGNVIVTGVGGEDNVQVIKVMDTEPPIITATNLTVNANIPGVHPQPCRSTAAFPSPGVTDNCSGVASVVINTQFGQVVNGHIPDPGLPIGLHIVTIQAFDNCGNVAKGHRANGHRRHCPNADLC